MTKKEEFEQGNNKAVYVENVETKKGSFKDFVVEVFVSAYVFIALAIVLYVIPFLAGLLGLMLQTLFFYLILTHVFHVDTTLMYLFFLLLYINIVMMLINYIVKKIKNKNTNNN